LWGTLGLFMTTLEAGCCSLAVTEPLLLSDHLYQQLRQLIHGSLRRVQMTLGCLETTTRSTTLLGTMLVIKRSPLEACQIAVGIMTHSFGKIRRCCESFRRIGLAVVAYTLWLMMRGITWSYSMVEVLL